MPETTTQSAHPHHLEDFTPRFRGPSTKKSVLNPVMIGLVIGALFVAVFLAAFHAPEPHDLPVGIVGSAQQVEMAERALEQNAPGSIEFTAYGSAADAQDAIAHRDVFGAYVMAGNGAKPRLLYAGANGPGVTSTLQGIFGAVAQHSHTTLEKQDVLPAASGDTRGLAIFYTGFGLVLGGFLFGLVSSQMAPHLQLRWRILSLAIFSVVAGAAVAVIAGGAGFNVLPGSMIAIMSVTVMLAAGVGAGTILLMHLGGPAGTLLTSLVLLILGNATSGGTLPAAYLPGWLRPFSDILPAGIGLRALYGESYFNGDGYVRGVILLAAWIIASLGIVYLLDFFKDRRKTRARRQLA